MSTETKVEAKVVFFDKEMNSFLINFLKAEKWRSRQAFLPVSSA